MPSTYDFSHYPGDSLLMNTTYSAGTPPALVDLTGYTIEFVMTYRVAGVLKKLVATNLEVTGNDVGEIALNLTQARTEALLGAKKASYQLRVTSGPGGITTTILTGDVEILKSPIESAEFIPV